MRFGRAGLFAAIFIWSGCASVQVVPVQNETGSEGRVLGHEAGVRFYRPALYVWITASPRKKGDPVEYEAKIVVLPDFSEEYAIQWKTGLGSVNPRFELTDGWNPGPHHIRSMAEALGRRPPASRYSPDMSKHAYQGTDDNIPDYYKKLGEMYE